MKKLILIPVLFIVCASFAGTNKAKENLGMVARWDNPSSWVLNRLPQHGDTVIIPVNTLVTIDHNENLPGSVLHIQVYGTLKFAGGKLSLGEGSRIDVMASGLIIKIGSPAETIRIGNDLKFGQDDVSIVGPAYADDSTPTSPLGFNLIASHDYALNIKLLGFSVAKLNNNVAIQWSATNEEEANLYDLQRSFDGRNWKSVAYITAIGGNTVNNYSYKDKNVTAKTVYYRIKQVENTGKFAFSPIKFLNTLSASEIKIAALTQNKILVQFSEVVEGNVNVMITSTNGQVISRQSVNNPEGQMIIDAPVMAKGNYIVTVSDGQTLNFSRQVIL